jgi:hypothetical protein
MTHPFLASPEALDAFIQDWRNGRLPRAAWTHAAHVAVCAALAVDRDADATFGAMKEGILAFATAAGVVHTPTSGYHETLTRLWATLIAHHVHVRRARTPWAAAVDAVDRFGEDRDLPRRCYSFDVVTDVRARAEWVAPDRLSETLRAVA